MNNLPERDERTLAVENASYRWGFYFITYALLLDVAYQSFRYNRATWDLLAIVLGGGAITSLYQARERILCRSWWKPALLAAGIGAVVAAIAAFLM